MHTRTCTGTHVIANNKVHYGDERGTVKTERIPENGARATTTKERKHSFMRLLNSLAADVRRQLQPHRSCRSSCVAPVSQWMRRRRRKKVSPKTVVEASWGTLLLLFLSKESRLLSLITILSLRCLFSFRFVVVFFGFGEGWRKQNKTTKNCRFSL